MNVLASLKTRTILISLCVFGVFALPGLALAQTGGPVESFAQELSWGFVNSVFGFFVWAGGMILNYAVTNFVSGFGAIYIDGGLGYSVNLLWGIVRDVFNLTFIFGLVFIGFKLILNSGDSSAKRMLGTLIMAALLVNFSLFFTKLVIDFTNIAATQFAAGFLNGTTYDVSGTFMSLFGLGGLWSTELDLPGLVRGQGWIYIFLSMILFLIAAFVFFAGGILLSIRFVVLNIYMILSPIMFLGWVFPGFSSTSREYWSGFLQRAFFAPAYMLMIYLSNQVLVNYQATLPRERFSGIFTDNAARATASFDATVPFFLVAAIFLIASLVVAQKMGAQGATTAIALGKRAVNRSKKIAVGAVGWAPRVAVNSLGDKAAKYGNRLQTKDFKNSSVVGGTLGWVARTNVADRLGGAVTGGMKNAKLGTGTTNSAESEYKRKTMIKVNQTVAEEDRKKKVKAAEETLNNDQSSAGDLNTALEDLTKVMKDMTEAEKENFVLDRQSKDDFKTVAINLSESDIEKFEKSGKFSASEIGAIKGARSNGFKSVAQTGHTFTTPDASGNFSSNPPTHAFAGATDATTGEAIIDRRKKVATMSTKDAGKLPVAIFKESAMYDIITPAMLEERMRNGVDTNDLSEIRNAMANNYGFGTMTPSEFKRNYPTWPDIDKNPWLKWENSNSTYAAQFFK